MENHEIQALKDKIDRESIILQMVNNNENKVFDKLYPIILIMFGMVIGYFLGKIWLIKNLEKIIKLFMEN